MSKIKFFSLIIVCYFYCTSLYAQVGVTIEIKGVTDEIATNVRLFLSIEQQKSHTLLTEGRLRRIHNKAQQEIVNALQPFGYYRPVIDSKLTQPSPNQWLATYTINAGPPLLISQLKLIVKGGAKSDTEFKTLIEGVPLHKGNIFNHATYGAVKSSFINLAVERGYFRAKFIQNKVEIDLNVYEARVYLEFDSGPRYLFGEITIQQDVLDQDLLQRYIPFKKGSMYTLSKVIELQHALNDSNYFNSVEVSSGKPLDKSTEIPINVSLKPRKKNRYTFGLGYGTDTGARAKIGWEKPRVNKKGHRFNTEAKVSELGHSASAYYRVPILNPRTDQMIYSIGETNEKTETSDSTLRSIGAALNRNHNDWRESIAINYQQEEYIISNDRGDSTLLIPNVNWSRTWGNNFINTIDGLRFDIGFRGANKSLLSDTDFFQVQSGIKVISSFGQYNRIIARGRIGSTSTQEFNQLPASVRFFAGGTQSVRGYEYQSLGPKDVNGKVIGGKHLMTGSIEFEHSFSNKWGAAIFYDAGNAIDNINDKLERGAGIGFRWKSPVGTIRIDIANAVSRDDNQWRLHINIGPDL